MSHYKSNTFQAFWVGLGGFSSFALTLVSAAILSRYFDKTEYGTYRQILYVYNTLLIIFTAGLPRVFGFFLPRYPVEQGKAIVWKVSKVLFLFGLIFSLVLYFSSGIIASMLKNPELETGLKYFSPIPTLLLPTLGIEGIFSTYKKTIYIAIYNTISRFLMLAFIVLPVIILKGSYLYAIYGWLVVSFIVLIMAIIFKGIPFKKIKSEETSLKLKPIFAYSLPLVGSSIAGIAISSADQFYISRYFGAEVFAEFANGFIQLPFVTMIVTATSTVLMPEFSRMVNDKEDFSRIKALWKNALVKSAIILFPLLIFFIFNATPIVVLLFSEKYLNSALFFKIGMFKNFFHIIAFAPLLFSLGETKYYSLIHVLCAVLAWSVNYILVITFKSPIPVAVFSVVISLLLLILGLVKISKSFKVSITELFPVRMFSVIIIHTLLVVLLIEGIKWSLPYEFSSVYWIGVSALIYGALILLSARFFGIDYLSSVKVLLNKKGSP